MNPGAALRALHPIKTYTCVVCGAGFPASDTRAMYCSNRCAQSAKYQRKKAKKALTNEESP